MARKPRLSHCEAKAILQKQGVDFSKDSDELPVGQLVEVAEISRRTGYRKSKGAPASTGAMYFRLLKRQRACPR